jgi:hypothetical protein
MNFQNLSLVDTANKKRGTFNGGRKAGQKFTGIRFSRIEGKKGVISKFTTSEALWKKLNLEGNGFFQLDEKTATGETANVFLGCTSLTAEGKLRARMLRQREGSGRGKSFKSTNLEESLISAGLLSEDFGKTFFQLEEAGEYEGVPMFKVVVDETIGAVSKTVTESPNAAIQEEAVSDAEFDANDQFAESEEEEDDNI